MAKTQEELRQMQLERIKQATAQMTPEQVSQYKLPEELQQQATPIQQTYELGKVPNELIKEGFEFASTSGKQYVYQKIGEGLQPVLKAGEKEKVITPEPVKEQKPITPTVTAEVKPVTSNPKTEEEAISAMDETDRWNYNVLSKDLSKVTEERDALKKQLESAQTGYQQASDMLKSQAETIKSLGQMYGESVTSLLTSVQKNLSQGDFLDVNNDEFKKNLESMIMESGGNVDTPDFASKVIDMAQNFVVKRGLENQQLPSVSNLQNKSALGTMGIEKSMTSATTAIQAGLTDEEKAKKDLNAFYSNLTNYDNLLNLANQGKVDLSSNSAELTLSKINTMIYDKAQNDLTKQFLDTLYQKTLTRANELKAQESTNLAFLNSELELIKKSLDTQLIYNTDKLEWQKQEILADEKNFSETSARMLEDYQKKADKMESYTKSKLVAMGIPLESTAAISILSESQSNFIGQIENARSNIEREQFNYTKALADNSNEMNKLKNDYTNTIIENNLNYSKLKIEQTYKTSDELMRIEENFLTTEYEKTLQSYQTMKETQAYFDQLEREEKSKIREEYIRAKDSQNDSISKYYTNLGVLWKYNESGDVIPFTDEKGEIVYQADHKTNIVDKNLSESLGYYVNQYGDTIPSLSGMTPKAGIHTVKTGDDGSISIVYDDGTIKKTDFNIYDNNLIDRELQGLSYYGNVGDSIVLDVQEGEAGGQCGEFTNNYLGEKVFANLISEKMSKANSPAPVAGGAIIFDNGSKSGHVAVIEQITPEGINLVESNFDGHETISRRTLSFDDLSAMIKNGKVGFYNPLDKKQKYQLSDEDVMAQEDKLRGEATKLTDSLKTIKEFTTRIQIGIKDFESQLRKGKDLSAATQTVIMSFNKILDEGSVVRESEYERIGVSQSWENKLKGMVQSIEQGGPGVAGAVIKDMERVAKQMYAASESAMFERNKPLFNAAEERGVNLQNIFSGEVLQYLQEKQKSPEQISKEELTESDVIQIQGIIKELKQSGYSDSDIAQELISDGLNPDIFFKQGIEVDYNRPVTQWGGAGGSW